MVNMEFTQVHATVVEESLSLMGATLEGPRVAPARVLPSIWMAQRRRWGVGRAGHLGKTTLSKFYLTHCEEQGPKPKLEFCFLHKLEVEFSPTSAREENTPSDSNQMSWF